MNKQNEDKDTDSLFSARCYAVSNELATTIGRLLTAIRSNQGVDWWSASSDCLAAKVHAMFLQGYADIPMKSILAGFLLLHPLVNYQKTDQSEWSEYFETLRKIFPAWDAGVIQGENPLLSKEDAETIAFLRFDRDLLESVYSSVL
jgi:hypothetical protein